ncbi:MAG: glycosyltransferase [Terracidiphilus sp.]|jgi:glycosyltransferase involved in cell wall biosynthesis
MSHVALVIPGLDRIGGAERQVILLARGLCQRGWRVSVVALSGTGGDTAAELTGAGAGFLSLGMRKGLADPRGWIRFHRWLRQEKPDVVHAHLPHATWLARWSRLAAPSRVLVDTLHSSSTGTLGWRLGYRWSGWLTDKVTAVSQAVAEAYFFAGMTSADKLAVLPNGVDVEVWRPDSAVRTAMRRELGLEDEFLWFAAGRLDAVKDYPALLSAMVHVPKTARLVIAGSGSLQSELQRLSTRLGLDGRVRFLGFEPDVRRWMRAADGFVLSSLREGLPMGLLEASACALPAVATDVPGTREVIVDGKTGRLALAGDAAALGEAMTRMMRTPPEERRTMGERARQHVMDRFSLKAVLDLWESQYGELLKRNPKPIRYGRAE